MRALLLVGVLLLWGTALEALAATLALTPAQGSYSVGSSITVKAVVSSDVPINAVSGSLRFSNDTLSLASISKSGSILSFWTEEPTYSNAGGTALFEGVSLSGGGYKGSGGTVLSITFTAKAAGSGTVSFASGSVLAHDGSGTNVLTGTSGAAFTIGGAQPQVTPSSDPGVSEAPTVTSSTHPDQSKWYSADDAEFAWSLPTGTLEVQTLLDERAFSLPTKSYVPAIASKKVSDLDDGTHYFHIRLRTKAGWSKTAHYQVNVDTIPPRAFTIQFPHGSTSLDPQPIVLFNTTDDGSGIERYDVKLGQEGPLHLASDALSNPYAIPPQTPGEHTIEVVAYDEAGNARTETATFTIDGIAPPTVTYYTESLVEGDLFRVRGTTYSNAQVNIIIRDNEGTVLDEEFTKSNSLGDFAIVPSKRITAGTHAFTLWVTDDRGARSIETSPLTFTVRDRLLQGIQDFLANNYILTSFLIGVMVIAVITAFFIMRHTARLINRLRRERGEAAKIIRASFGILRRDLDTFVSKFKRARKKRPLTPEELAFLDQFDHELSDAEHAIERGLDDIPNG